MAQFLGTPMHIYTKVRIEGAPPIPCDQCMGGMDAPWFIGSYLGDEAQVARNEAPLAYVLCAGCAVDINKMTDTCSDCIPDPTDDRVCDNCSKEYRRKTPVVEEVAA